MSYQVLARKWRPRAFSEMLGQGHVLRALSNALDSDRIHHAFLFTGTRGVGKTTVGRILAKSLNCEQGVGSTPCNACAACREIDEGRFVDLIEVDAASRTKVDETRELLENVPYAPTRGRFKVYLIDEVHMFSGHSFNALLKTLEEPPPHVKFLLATTDPQKLPVTILSRCLQFNLKRLSADAIAGHLERITGAEGIEAQPAALRLLAVAADGSVRDGLSLLDQAIAYGGGQVSEADVRAMLGTIDQGRVAALVEALAAGEGSALMEAVAQMAEHVPDFDAVLAELISFLQRIALAQVVPGALREDLGDQEPVKSLAGRMSAEDVQLYYQIALAGRRDLALVPDPRAGFEMTLLRMLAFRPQEAPARGASSAGAAGAGASAGAAVREAPPAAVPAAASSPVPEPSGGTGDAWSDMVQGMGLSGLLRELAMNSVLESREQGRVHLVLNQSHAQVHSKSREAQLQQALERHLGGPLKLVLEIGTPGTETPAQRRERLLDERQQAAEQAIEGDPNVQHMREVFGASVVEDSVRPDQSGQWGSRKA